MPPKTKPCRKVLQLMDKGFDYEKALSIVLSMFPNIDKKELEEELDLYI